MQYLAVKDPQEEKDYTIDWSDDLASGETISTSDWVVGTGLTEEDDENNTTTTTAWVSGGTAGTEYLCVNTVTTSGGRTLERTVIIPVTNQ